jgi:hypothetical protein
MKRFWVGLVATGGAAHGSSPDATGMREEFESVPVARVPPRRGGCWRSRSRASMRSPGTLKANLIVRQAKRILFQIDG